MHDRRGPRTFRFERLWRVRACRPGVFAALADVHAYPVWWPQIREVTQYTEDTGSARIRSVLPYSLHVDLTRVVDDADRGRLRVRLEGDLVGWAAFDVREVAEGWTEALFTEEVRVGERWLGRVDRLLGPVLRANHEAMMRAGESGLRGLFATKS